MKPLLGETQTRWTVIAAFFRDYSPRRSASNLNAVGTIYCRTTIPVGGLLIFQGVGSSVGTNDDLWIFAEEK